MNDVTFQILKIVVSAAALIITTVLVPYVKEKIKDTKYERLLNIVETGVKAAEQIYKEGQGETKKEEVILFVSNWMIDHGIKITNEQLSQLIEAAVYRMNADKKKEG